MTKLVILAGMVAEALFAGLGTCRTDYHLIVVIIISPILVIKC